MTEDVSQRLTEMLDNAPASSSSILEIDEQSLIEDYKRVQSGEIADTATVRRLASMFASVAADPVLVRQVSFDANHACAQLIAHADQL